MKQQPHSVVLRPWLSLLVVATSSAAAFVLTAGFALIPLGLNQNADAWAALGALTALVFLVAIVRVRCVLTSEALEVVNLWRTYSIPWGAVLRTESADAWVGAAFFLSIFSPLRIRTTDGRKIIVQASLFDDKGLIARSIESGTSAKG